MLYEMKISQDNSKILVINIKSVSPDISIRQEKLEAVQSFKYLGIAIMEDGRPIFVSLGGERGRLRPVA